MPQPDTTRRLPYRVIKRDVTSYDNLPAVGAFNAPRPEFTYEGLIQLFNQMRESQQEEAALKGQYQVAVDAARMAEWNFHNAVLNVRQLVLGQFGLDSDEAQLVGFKRKSKRKRPSRRQPPEPAMVKGAEE